MQVEKAVKNVPQRETYGIKHCLQDSGGGSVNGAERE